MSGGGLQRTYWGTVTATVRERHHLPDEIRRTLKPYTSAPKDGILGGNRGGLGLVADAPQVTSDGLSASISLWSEQWVDCAACAQSAAEIERLSGLVVTANNTIGEANTIIEGQNARIHALSGQVGQFRVEAGRLGGELAAANGEVQRLNAELLRANQLVTEREQRDQNSAARGKSPPYVWVITGGTEVWDGAIHHHTLPDGEKLFLYENGADSAADSDADSAPSTARGALRDQILQRYGHILRVLRDGDEFLDLVSEAGLFVQKASVRTNDDHTQTVILDVLIPLLGAVDVQERGLGLNFLVQPGWLQTREAWSAATPHLSAAFEAPQLVARPWHGRSDVFRVDVNDQTS